jgi:S1-C subfamily serine protease
VLAAQREAMLGNQIVYVGGDILQTVDGVAIETTSQLEGLLEEKYRLGDQVHITLLRDGQPLEVTVALAEDPN